MRRFFVPALISVSLVLAACNFGTGTTGGDSSSSASSEDSGVVTRNVSYTGTLEELGVTTYMQGTHKLTLGDGQFLLVESTDANLSLESYLGKRVEIRGSVQPTVEAGGMLLRAEEVTVLDLSADSSASSSSSSSSRKMCGGIAGFQCDAGEDCVDDPSDSCDPMNGGADCGGICVPQKASSSSVAMAVSSKAASSVMKSSVASSAVSVSSSVASSTGNSAAIEQQVVLMAKQSYEPALWTQTYCTSHIAFCVPVHKNWYFKSFGATTSNLWHIELGMSDIESLGQGAIVLNLVSGTSASMQAQDGQIKTQGSDIIGFKDWTDGTHFELIADARLRTAVSYMLSNITAYTPAQ